MVFQDIDFIIIFLIEILEDRFLVLSVDDFDQLEVV